MDPEETFEEENVDEVFCVALPEETEGDDEGTVIVFPVVSPDVAATYW